MGLLSLRKPPRCVMAAPADRLAEAAPAAEPPAGWTGLGRRFAFGLAGEGAQSAFHFGLNVALLHHLSEYDYGLFAIVFVMGSLALTYSNALVATPVSVALPRLRRPGAADVQDSVFGAVALASSLLLAAGVGLALWLATSLAWIGPAGAAFIGFWSLRNYVRAALFARREAQYATAGDACFAASGILLAGLALAWAPGERLLVAALGALAAANALGCAAALATSGRPIRLSFDGRTWRHYRRHGSMVRWALVGVTTSNVQAQCQTFLVAVLVGPAAFAPIAAGLLLQAPLRIAVAALIGIVRPDFSEALAAGRLAHVRRLLQLTAALILAGSLAYGGLLWLGREIVRTYVFGPALAHEPMALVALLSWATAFVYLGYFLPQALLEAAGEFRSVAQATLISAGAALICVSVLLVVAEPVWSLLGVIAAEMVTLVWFWRAAIRIVRR